MPTVVLPPGDVWTFNTGTVNRGPIWSDNDDSTFGLVRSAPAISAHGWLPPSGTDPASVTAISIAARIVVSASEPNQATLCPQITFADPGGGSSAPFTDLLMVPRLEPGSGTGLFVDVLYTADAADYAQQGLDMLAVATRLTQTDPSAPGMRAIRFRVNMDDPLEDAIILVSEASVLLTVGDGPTPQDYPATRLYPREDGNGLSAGARLVPPPRAGRVVGGYR